MYLTAILLVLFSIVIKIVAQTKSTTTSSVKTNPYSNTNKNRKVKTYSNGLRGAQYDCSKVLSYMSSAKWRIINNSDSKLKFMASDVINDIAKLTKQSSSVVSGCIYANNMK